MCYFQLLPDCKYKTTEVGVSIGSEKFTWSGCTPVTPGYTEVYSWHAIQCEDSPKEFEMGQVWEICQVYISFLYMFENVK